MFGFRSSVPAALPQPPARATHQTNAAGDRAPRLPPGRTIERMLLLAPLPIGDTLFTTPTIAALRQRYPSARITALTHSASEPLLRCVPGLDDVVLLPTGPDWAGPAALLRTLRTLRADRYDVAIDFSSPAYKWIALLAGIPRRTYMKFDPDWWWLPAQHRRWQATHATEHYYDCARELDLPPWEATSHPLLLSVPAQARDEARAYIAAHAWGGRHGPLVGLHAGGTMLDGVKRWPADHFATLADRLAAEHGARVVLLGGSDECDLAAYVAARMRQPVVNAAGDVPLLTSLALITACDLFIGNDSGLLHAAAALGTPYVGIYGPTAPASFHPVPARAGQGTLALPPVACRAPRHFIGGDVIWSRPCCEGTCDALLTLSVERVLAQATRLLARRDRELIGGPA